MQTGNTIFIKPVSARFAHSVIGTRHAIKKNYMPTHSNCNIPIFGNSSLQRYYSYVCNVRCGHNFSYAITIGQNFVITRLKTLHMSERKAESRKHDRNFTMKSENLKNDRTSFFTPRPIQFHNSNLTPFL